MNTSDMGSPIQMGLGSSDSSIFETSSLDLLDIPELGSSLWEPTLDIIQVQPPPSDAPSALQFPSILGDGLEEKEIDLIMYYVAVSKNMQSSYLHLSSAALSLAQLLDNTSALDSSSISTNTTPPSSVLTTDLYHAGSMEYKALRCFSIILIWNDILHCSAQQTIPAAAKTYQKLLADESFIPLFADIVGCEGWVLVPILEAMLLASWKKDQEAKGQLSIRELLTKVDHIESILGDRMKRLAPAVLRQKEAGISSQSPEQIRLVHTYIFAHASFVHLHTVVSGAQPSVPEIRQSIDKSLAAWQLLPPSLINFKTMAWPFCVCGSMAVGSQRELFQKIMSENFQNQSTSSNLHCLKSVVEECWKNFDKRVPEQSPSSYNWKVVMEKLNLSILFI
ncbi:unnamed protein product [Aspergillus oryzae]|nr:unnamed protein product [Aspergillus oryzae]